MKMFCYYKKQCLVVFDTSLCGFSFKFLFFRAKISTPGGQNAGSWCEHIAKLQGESTSNTQTFLTMT